jgi:hypothetical protein
MQEENAISFYERVTQGKEQYKTITLEHHQGATLSDVKMYAIGKRELAGVIERLPDEMLEQAEEANGDVDEEELEGEGDLGAITEETVDAFEDLASLSLSHDDLTDVQMKHIVKELDFETLFELGSEIINMSVEDTGDIRGFREQE